MSASRYANPETVEKIEAAREQINQGAISDAGTTQSGLKDVDPLDAAEARETIANEAQPDRSHLPAPSTRTIDWRGTDLEFDEMGASLMRMMRFYAEGDNAGMLDYLTTTLDEKCRDPAADKIYWEQFDLMNDDDDPDSLMDLFERLTGSEDLTPEQREAAENLLNQSQVS